MLFLAILVGIVSVFVLIKGSDWSTESIARVAKRLGVSHVAIGLILVSLMVSLPEIFVAISSLVQNRPAIGLGVIIGSVIANIGLMVGISAMIRPFKVQRSLILRDGVFSVIVAILVLILAIDGTITGAEGWAFILLFIPYLINVWATEKSEPKAEREEELKEAVLELKLFGIKLWNLKASSWTFFLGLILLLAGSFAFTWSLGIIGAKSGVSDFIVGLTLGALGTSIPNIASAIQATIKNLDQVAISETLGSNIFTLLVTLGIIAAFQPVKVLPRWLAFDIPIMVLMSLLLFGFMIFRQRITRGEGILLVGLYVVFLVGNVFIAG
ncbi:MAG: sodium:calcium antiporter [Candidatus Woesearchaeota archaeon]